MTGPANGRAHLSIGEVLSLLQDEFPDVTISKIRFLESQGLLDPERTPSGYRKFYHADIERLRWVLRQQKEHYLPLKVIKDRLDEAGGAIPEDEPATDPAQAPHPEPDRGQPAREVNGAPAKRQAVKAREHRRRPHVNGVATGNSGGGGRSSNHANPPVTPPRRWPDSRWDEPDDPAAERLSPTVLPAPPPRPAPPLSGRTEDQQSHPPGWIDSRGVPASSNPANRPPAGDPVGAAGPGKRPPGDDRPPAEPRIPVPLLQPDEHLNPAVLADVSLTVEELAEASGLSVREIRDLERYGLLEPQGEDGDGGYDGDALIVAHTAAGFLQHGIEARHMRTYKVAMEREAGLFEQIVLPVLKQRNPEARVRVARTLTELIRLGEVMRSVLLRQALRDYLNAGG